MEGGKEELPLEGIRAESSRTRELRIRHDSIMRESGMGLICHVPVGTGAEKPEKPHRIRRVPNEDESRRYNFQNNYELT